MPRTEANLPGRTLARGNPLDAVFGTDLLDPAGLIKTEGTGLTTKYDYIEPGEPFIVHVNINGAVAKGTIPVVASAFPFKALLYDVVVIPAGAETGGTIKVTDGTNDITNAMTCAVDKTIARAGTIDDAYSTIAQGGSISLVTASSGTDQCAADVFLCFMRVV